MAAAFRSAQEVGYATGSSIAYGTLASLTAGDRMYAVFYVGGSVTVTTPAGWSQWFSPIAFTGGGSPYRVYGFYKTADGTETTQTFSWTGSLGHGGIIFAYSGVDATTQFDVTTVSAAGSSTSLSAPTMTTVTDNALLVWIGVLFGSFNGSQTPPSGMTKRYGSPSGQDYLLADEVMATHGPTGAKSITVTSGPWIAIMAALRPAASSIAVSLSGSGSLTVAGSPTGIGAAGMGGSGTLSASEKPSVSVTAALSGTGALMAIETPSVAAGAALGGEGSLAATGSPASGASVALSGVGSLEAAGTPTVGVPVALVGAGTLSATGMPSAAALASLGGTGTLTAVSGGSGGSSPQLGGSGSLTASATPSFGSGPAFGGIGQLDIATSVIVPALVLLAGAGVLTVHGAVPHPNRDITIVVLAIPARFEVDAIPDRFSVQALPPRFEIVEAP